MCQARGLGDRVHIHTLSTALAYLSLQEATAGPQSRLSRPMDGIPASSKRCSSAGLDAVEISLGKDRDPSTRCLLTQKEHSVSDIAYDGI